MEQLTCAFRLTFVIECVLEILVSKIKDNVWCISKYYHVISPPDKPSIAKYVYKYKLKCSSSVHRVGFSCIHTRDTSVLLHNPPFPHTISCV